MKLPPASLLADLFRHLPFLIFHTTTDGTILHCNPEALRVTGFTEGELVGKNLWAVLCPGKLFAQVPKFISLLDPSPLLKDIPMTIRTRDNKERVIGLSRFVHQGATRDTADVAPRTFLCVGVDLTDRLLDSEREKLPPTYLTEAELGEITAFGASMGNAGAIEGEFVTPIAITPKVPRPSDRASQEPTSLQKVRDSLARVETHMECVCGAFAESETYLLRTLRMTARRPIVAHPAFAFLADGEWLHAQLHDSAMTSIRARVDEMLTLYKPEMA